MKKIVIGLSFLLLSKLAFTQAGFENGKNPADAFLRKIIPPSPTAASLGKYGDQQINMFTGTAAVNIPIYEIKANDLSVPLSLTYSSSGLRVTEAASWVGLGWSLNGMGVITRVTRGAADFTGGKDFFNIRTFPLPLTYSNVNDAGWNYLHANFSTYLDPEPDLYMVQAPGLSIKFYYDRFKRIQTIPYNNQIRITQGVGQYIITNEAGNKYYFGSTDANETTSPEGATPYISSWYLTKMVSSSGNEINFAYSNDRTSIVQDQYSETEEVKPAGVGQTGDCYTTESGPSGRTAQFTKQTILLSRLSTIETDNEIVYLIKDGTSREDEPGDYALKKIEVYSKSLTKYIFRYELNYDYFPQVSQTCWGQNSSITHWHNKTAICKRLRLNQFVEKGDETNGSDYKLYQFSYSTKALPSRCSLDQDHWGYYNGAGNTSLLPLVSGADFQGSIFNANSREANHSYADAGLLLKIIYPTGGETDFTYEANEVKTVSNQASLQTTSASVSGISPQLESSVNFTLNALQPVLINYTLDDQNLIDQGLQRKVEIKDQSGAVRFMAFNSNSPTGGILINGMFTGTLEPGTYTLKVSRNYSYSDYPAIPAIGISASVSYNPLNTSSIVTRKIGGFRIKKIIDETVSGGTEINVKEYLYDNPYVIANIEADNYKANYKRGFWSSSAQYAYECWFYSRNSSAVQPIGSIQGSHIGYGKVTTKYGLNGSNGKSESFFSTDPDQGGYSMYPITRPVTSYDHRRGNLLKRIDYNANSDVVKIMNNVYDYILKFDGNFSRPFYTVDKPIGTIQVGVSLIPYKQVAFIDFALPSEIVRLKSSSETIYAGSAYSSSVSEYAYNNPNHLNVTETKMVNSKKETISTTSTYPLDYKPASTKCIEEIERTFETDYTNLYNSFYSCNNAASGTTAINACYTNYQTAYDNLISNRTTTLTNYQATFISLANNTSDEVLKNRYKLIAYNKLAASIQSVTNKNGVTELESSVTEYNDFSGKILPSKMSSSTLGDALITNVTFDLYDANGNLLQAIQRNGLVQSFIWDYNNTYPIAKVSNAVKTDVAYTSFEADGPGNFTIGSTSRITNDGITGKQCYQLSNGAITKTELIPGREYIVSYWTKNASSFSINGTTGIKALTIGSWTCFKHAINLSGISISISGTGYIDELRVYPKDAQIMTYTYEPLIGMTSASDVNNVITYYTYDVFGRLKSVLDKDKNIIKLIDYRYNTSTVTSSENCNSAVGGNCVGVDKKCINNYCQQGRRINTSTVKRPNGTWRCTYYYIWGNPSNPDFQEGPFQEINNVPCAIDEIN